VEREYDSICAELQLPEVPTTTPTIEYNDVELELVPLTT